MEPAARLTSTCLLHAALRAAFAVLPLPAVLTQETLLLYGLHIHDPSVMFCCPFSSTRTCS